jgi:hypothetical protein
MTMITDEVVRDSPVGVAVGWGLHDKVSFPVRVRNFFLSLAFLPALGST